MCKRIATVSLGIGLGSSQFSAGRVPCPLNIHPSCAAFSDPRAPKILSTQIPYQVCGGLTEATLCSSGSAHSWESCVRFFNSYSGSPGLDIFNIFYGSRVFTLCSLGIKIEMRFC